MLDELERECAGCGRALAGEPAIVYRTDAGERRAYACACGAVTVTAVAPEAESTR